MENGPEGPQPQAHKADPPAADGMYTAAEMIEIRMRATRSAKHDATIAEWERIEQERIEREDARETIQPATDEESFRSGLKKLLPPGAPRRDGPSTRLSPYPAWGVARSRPCHVIPLAGLAGLAGVYTRACAPARVGLANSANFVGTELRNGPGITARTGHLAAGQRRLPTRPNGFVDVSTWRSRRAELNREPLSHEEWSG